MSFGNRLLFVGCLAFFLIIMISWTSPLVVDDTAQDIAIGVSDAAIDIIDSSELPSEPTESPSDDGFHVNDLNDENNGCVDILDGGINPNKKGGILYYEGDKNEKYFDKCSSLDTVLEAVCYEGSDYTKIMCQKGEICQNGACAEKSSFLCINEDDGLDEYLTKSRAYNYIRGKERNVIEDSCASGDILLEAVCLGSPSPLGAVGTKEVNCEKEFGEGYACVEGSCKEIYKPGEKVWCGDSDGGENFDVKGTVIGHLPSGDKVRKTDECLSEVELKEYICKKEGYRVVRVDSVTHDCSPLGCKDGKCIKPAKPSPSCFDGDGGKDQYTASDATKGKRFFEDVCLGEDVVFEAICTDNELGLVAITCDKSLGESCVEGKCVRKSGWELFWDAIS